MQGVDQTPERQSIDMANQTGETSSTCIQSPVCEACRSRPVTPDSFRQAIVENPEDSKGGFSYTTTWEKIQVSVKEGCKWCFLLVSLKRSRPGMAPAPKPVGEAEVRLCVNVGPMKSWSSLQLFIDSKQFGPFGIYADPGDEAAEYIGTGDYARDEISFPDHTVIPDYNVASKWIRECPDHKFCLKPEKVDLPTRVIDCSQPEKPKLVITEDLPPGERKDYYAALSYVWGQGVEQPKKTTKENVDSYVKGINGPLPQTIVDAIVVTHKLSGTSGFLKYLWVDSLCIVQDSKDDYAKETAQMADIYGNAYVTIAAASAYGSDKGFLKYQRPTIYLPFQSPDGKVGSMLVQYSGSLVRSMGYGSDGIETRAWCFQEKVLSPRILYFSRPFLLGYLCRTFFALYWSVHPDTPFKQPDPTYARALFPSVSLSDDQPPSYWQLIDLRTLWYKILADYSGRGMGRATDKLVAIAGVVNAFQRVWKGDYIAGLWRETLLDKQYSGQALIDDLFWRRILYRESALLELPEDEFTLLRPENNLLPRPESYRAPSWSWAAIDGEIERHRKHFSGPLSIEYECVILECKTTPKIDSPLEVADGILRINARMKEVTWDPINRKLVEPGSLWNGTEGTSADHRRISLDEVHPDSKEEVTEKEGKVWLVLLRLEKIPDHLAHGLFVVPDDDKEGCYRRVGTLRCYRVPDWYDEAPWKEITIV